MKTTLTTPLIYIKDKQTIQVDTENRFVYETSVYLFYKNYFSLCNQKYFSSKVEIKGVIGSFFKTRHIQLCTELIAAPEQWLLDNGFVKYIPEEKVKKTKVKKIDKIFT
jgi:hypothetical protein